MQLDCRAPIFTQFGPVPSRQLIANGQAGCTITTICTDVALVGGMRAGECEPLAGCPRPSWGVIKSCSP